MERRQPLLPWSRRHFLRASVGALGLPLLDLSHAVPADPPNPGSEAAFSNAVKGREKAKSCIQIWMWGGPSHLDTFDPKPQLGKDYCGPLTNPIGTNVDGIQLGELLPELAKQADKYSIIRSMTHGINGHETASYRMQTGREAGGRDVFPSLGAVVSMLKGYEAGYDSPIPPYVVLTSAQGRFSESGFLGQKYKPFVTGGDPSRTPFLVSGFVLQGITRERQIQRRNMLTTLDSLGKIQPENHVFQEFDAAKKEAYEVILGEGAKVFDLTTEPEELREKYGKNWFGQSCLMARRLVEEGVPWITINYRGWDTHKQHFNTLNRKQPEMDQGMAALFADLSERGLLDSTIVWWGGEFGRTPKVQWNPPWNGGRGHFGNCFSVVVGGGGFEGGKVVGASDGTGENVAERAVYPEDLLGSIYELMGIDPDAPLPNTRGKHVPIMAPPSEEGRLKEIMA